MIPDSSAHIINERVKRELARSIAKHGMWDQYSYPEMFNKILDETDEVDIAVKEDNHAGVHGTFNELAQVSACCQKMMHQIILREGAPSE